jgi:putative thioredoxin
MSEYIKAVTSSDFEKEVVEKSNTTPVLIDFWAQWCAPCKQLMPLLHQIVDSLNGALHLATVDTDAEQELSSSFGVRSLPTVLLMKNGEIVEQFMGVQPESEIRKLLEPHLTQTPTKSKNTSDAMQKAMDLINNGQVLQAIPYLEQEGSLHGKLLLIKIYLQEGEVGQAITSFAKLSNDEQENDEAKTIKTILDLIQLGQKSQNTALQQIIDEIVSVNPEQGINQLLQLLSEAQADEKNEIKQSLICAFNLIDDAKLVSQLRRKMAALIF